MRKNKLLEEGLNQQNGAQGNAKGKHNYRYLVGKGGHYLAKRNGIFTACVKVEECQEYPEVEEFFQLTTRKIPFSLFQQALAFLKAVHEKHKSEGMVLLTHKDGLWGIVIPKQEVSTASVKYENDGHTRVVGSIHSHPGFSSTPSGTDHHDEINFDGIHIVVSGFDCLADITVHAVVNGGRFQLRPDYAIEGLENKATFPEEWLQKVSPKMETWPFWSSHVDETKPKENCDCRECVCCEAHHEQCLSCEFDEEAELEEWPDEKPKGGVKP